MALLEDISSPNWSLSIANPGEVVEDIDDINQCIAVIFDTLPGSDPLRPQFGCDLYQHLDKPINVAAPAIIKKMATALESWEPRIQLTRVSYKVDLKNISRVIFSLDYDIILKKGSNKISYLTVNQNGGSNRPVNAGFDYVLNFTL